MRLLFVCARNRLRSPTAERVFAHVHGIETDSAGVAPDAEQLVSAEQIAWADVIFVMEGAHRAKLTRGFGSHLRGKRVVNLNVPDDYEYMNAGLIELLWDRVGRALPQIAAARPTDS